MEKWLEIFLTSVVLAIVVNLFSSILFEFYGKNLRNKIRKFRRRIFKFIKNESYPITISLKTTGLGKYRLTQKNFFAILEGLLRKKEVSFSPGKGILVFETAKGGLKVKCEVLPDYDSDDEKLKISEAQINIISEIKYRHFEKQFLDVYSIIDEIEKILAAKWRIKFNKISSLNLPQNVFFSDIKNTEIKRLNMVVDKHEIYIWKNKVDIYGDINSNLTKTIKEIILLYY